MIDTYLRTIVPIFSLIALGYFARRANIFKAGDEKVLSSYVYYLALPALFIFDLSNTRFSLLIWRYVAACLLPMAIILLAILLLGLILRFKKERIALLITSSIFGSTAFFGIPS